MKKNKISALLLTLPLFACSVPGGQADGRLELPAIRAGEKIIEYSGYTDIAYSSSSSKQADPDKVAFTDNSNAPLTPTAGTYVYSTVTSTVADTELSASAWTDCGYFIAIPQDITVAGAKASIKYEYQVGNKTYTKTVDNLSLKSKDTTAWTAWAKGTHYTYNITIGLKEILFTVTIASGWSDGGAKEIY